MKKNSFVAMVLGSISVLFFRTGHVYDNDMEQHDP